MPTKNTWSKVVQGFIKPAMKKIEEADNMSIVVSDLDYRTMVASINGPPGTPYEDWKIILNISFPKDYPFKAPHITCAIKVWHPNINLDSGNICLDILYHNFSPAITIDKILLSIMSFLCDPNPSDPMNCIAALQYTENRENFDAEVKKYMSLQIPTTNTNKCMSTSDISTRLALAWCIWNAGQKGKGTLGSVQWELDEVMVAILNVHRDTSGRFPEEFDNWSIILRDANERSTHRKVKLHINQCQDSADPQNDECVVVYNLPVGGRRVAYIHEKKGAAYQCINTLRMDKSDFLEIPVNREGNIIYTVSITSTNYDIFSTIYEIGLENKYLDDHWDLFLAMAPKQESELEDFCRQMHLLGYYQACMRRWKMGKFSFTDKLTDLFYRWRRVLRDTTFGFNDGLKLITFLEQRLAGKHQAHSLTSEASQQQGAPSTHNSCPAKSSYTFCSSPPTQEEDQGQTFTCTRYALTKCVFNSAKEKQKRKYMYHAEEMQMPEEKEQVPLISQSLISTAVLNILPDCHGSWPEEFDDQVFLAIEKDKEGSMIDVIKIAMHIQLCKPADYTSDKEYILVYSNEDAGSIHTVYVEGKDGDSWKCRNSWGKYDNILHIPTNAPGNQLYKVDVQKVERDKKSFYLRERLGPRAFKIFLDNMKESIEPKDNQGLQTYCNRMGSFYHKFEPRWERDHLEWTIRLEEVFEHLWQEKYEYFIVQLLLSLKHHIIHESEEKTLADSAMPAEDNEHQVKNDEYEEKDARSDVSTTTVHPGQSGKTADNEVVGLGHSMSEKYQPPFYAGVVEEDTPTTEADEDENGSNNDASVQLSKTKNLHCILT